MRNSRKILREGIKKLRFVTKQSEVIGQVPGKLVFVGDKKQDFTKIEIIAFNESEFEEAELDHISHIEHYKSKFDNIWINVDGLHDVDVIKEVGLFFDLHPLLMEDIVHTGQRAKIEIQDSYVFFIMKMMSLSNLQLEAEQFSMYLNENVLITFQEVEGDVFEPIRNRIRNKSGRVRKMGLDYLAYSLLDSIVDNYNGIMEYFGHQVEELEDKILMTPKSDVLHDINGYKIELNFFRKSIRPAREAILNIEPADISLMTQEVEPFYNDLKDSINRAYESVDGYKGMLSEQLTVYSINVNNKLNDIMKVLTIFSAVFIPLTFIVGVYGTNFDHVPELHYQHGYYIMWSVLIIIALGMIGYFKKIQWL